MPGRRCLSQRWHPPRPSIGRPPGRSTACVGFDRRSFRDAICASPRRHAQAVRSHALAREGGVAAPVSDASRNREPVFAQRKRDRPRDPHSHRLSPAWTARPPRQDHRPRPARRRHGDHLHRTSTPDCIKHWSRSPNGPPAGRRRRRASETLRRADDARVPIINLLKDQGVDDVLITVSRTIAQDDIVELEKLGAAKVYTPRTTTEEVIELIDSAVRGRR